MNHPYSHEELTDLRRRLGTRIEEHERENPNIRPLPPMTVEEAKEFILAFADAAATRVLTTDEVTLIGQGLAVYKMAVEAEMLKRKGRYFVLSEEDLERMMKSKE
jgi:hypothetical protein